MEPVQKELKTEYLNNLIKASNHASIRSRTTYFILSLSCFFVFLGVFNMEYSWERHINFNERNSLGFDRNLFPNDKGANLIIKNKALFDTSNKKSQMIYEKYIENMSNTYADELFKRYEVNIPVLGIRIFSSDLSLIASSGILIMITWLFWTIRREYHIVNKIKREFNLAGDNKSLRSFIYYGTVFENVFTTATKNNTSFIKISSKFQKIIFKIINPVRVLRVIRYLPTLAIGLTIFSDWHGLIGSMILKKYTLEIILRTLFALMSLFYSIAITKYIILFDKNIEKNLSFMNKKAY